MADFTLWGLKIPEIVALLGVGATWVTTLLAMRRSRTDSLANISATEERLRKGLSDEIARLERKIALLDEQNQRLTERIERCTEAECPVRKGRV